LAGFSLCWADFPSSLSRLSKYTTGRNLKERLPWEQNPWLLAWPQTPSPPQLGPDDLFTDTGMTLSSQDQAPALPPSCDSQTLNAVPCPAHHPLPRPCPFSVSGSGFPPFLPLGLSGSHISQEASMESSAFTDLHSNSYYPLAIVFLT
jgi:hypothetical protein